MKLPIKYSHLLFAAITIVLFIGFNSCDKDGDPPPPEPPPTDSLGVGWQKIQITGTAGLSDVFFVNNNVGWVCGQGVFKSTDGGITWNKQTVTNDSSGYSNLFFLDEQHGWMVGNFLFRTKNGGTNWNKLTVAGESTPYDVQFLNPRLGYLVGSKGLYRSTDSGTTWTKVVSNFTPTGAFFFRDSLRGWGLSNSAAGITVNGGANFTYANQFAGGSFYAMQFVDSLHGWVAGGGGVLRTIDGGVNWTRLLDYSNGADIHFFTKDVGYINYNGRVYKTTNGGQSLISQVHIPSATGFAEIHFIDENHGWAVAWNNNTLLRYSK